MYPLAHVSDSPTPEPLVVPPKAPTRVEQKLAVAYVAHRSVDSTSGIHEAELAARFWAEQLRRSSSSSVSRALRKLRMPPHEWLELSTASAGRAAHRYSLGPTAVDHGDQWRELGRRLYSTGGILAGGLGDPLIKHGYLNASGLLVVGALKEVGQGTAAMIRRHLGGLLARTTIGAAIERLAQLGLVLVEHDRVSLINDYERRLIHIALDNGTAAWALEQERSHREQRDAYADALADEAVAAEDAYLRTLPCIYCGTPAVPGEAEVEHFPPQHWVSSARYTIRLPSCRVHNHWLGQQVRGSSMAPHTPPPDVAFVSDAEHLEVFALRLLLNEHAIFTQLLVEGHADEAARRVGDVVGRLSAQRDRLAHVRHPESGASARLRSVHIHDVILAHLDDHRHRIAAIRHITPESAFWMAGQLRAPST